MGKLRLPTLVEVLAVLLTACLVGRYLWRIGGQVEGTDALLYLDVALKRAESTYILNRYSHVFLLSLFMSVAGSPLQGVRLFSGVIGGMTALLVYVGGRSLASTSGPWNGILALASFLSLTSVLKLFTRPEVDTTAMLMGACLAVTYIFSARAHHNRRWLVGLLGALLLLSFKAKETSLVAAVVLPGLGVEAAGTFRWRQLWKNLGVLGLGMLAGLVLVAVANAAVLGDPLFGLRPAEYLEQAGIAQAAFVLLPAPGDWFAQFVFPALGATFLLYVTSGLSAWDRAHKSVRLLWLVPVAQIVFLTLTMIWSTWGVVPRYFGFSLGILSILAGQVIGPHSAWKPSGRVSAAYLALATAVVGGLGLLGLLLRPSVVFPAYYGAVLGPIVLALMLGLLFVEGPISRRIQPAVLLCALVLTVYPARVSLGDEEKNLKVFPPNSRFAPLVAAQPYVKADNLASVFVSRAIADRLRVKDRNEVSAIFNLFFDARTKGDDFEFVEPDRALRQSMMDERYHLVLLTADDWDAIRVGDDDTPGWRGGYEVFVDPSSRFVVLGSRSE